MRRRRSLSSPMGLEDVPPINDRGLNSFLPWRASSSCRREQMMMMMMIMIRLHHLFFLETTN
jgi:hypothetical protein